MASTYEIVKKFKNKYPGTICWRIKKHSKLVDQNLYPDEVVNYAFAAQNNTSHGNIFDTAVLAITNKRLIIAQDYILFGYDLNSITPDLYNDMQVHAGIIWGMITIDTIKETIYFSNLSKQALSEIQKEITSYMMEAKAKYYKKEENKEALKVFERKIVGLKIKAFDDTLSKILWYQSPTDTNEIDIYFKLNEVMSQYKLKPQDYFKYLLLNSGEKSLISILKEKNLIITLTGDIDDSYNTFSTYKLRIVLTPEGVNQYDYVLEMVFDYLELIQEQKIN